MEDVEIQVEATPEEMRLLSKSVMGKRPAAGGCRNCDHWVESLLAERLEGSKFFMDDDKHPPPSLPEFSADEILAKTLLGEGAFGSVREIESFQKQRGGCGCDNICGNRPITKRSDTGVTSSSNNNSSTSVRPSVPLMIVSATPDTWTETTASTDENDDNNEDDISELRLEEDNEEEMEDYREYMINHVYRCGQYRYALKQLRQDLEHDRELALTDLAFEAKLMARLSHPNIVRLRGVLGDICNTENSFGLVLDRLNDTLTEKIDSWKVRKQSLPLRNLFQRVQRKKTLEWHQLLLERLFALYDIARAVRYLHSKSILYRDLKPDNVGTNLRGDYLIFDFGLSKELKEKDLVEPPEGYDSTGMTGSRRYMAPEVVNCKYYGLRADVFSFAILMWETLSLKVPFEKLKHRDHFEQVVLKHKRPPSLKTELPKALNDLMEQCWRAEPLERPTFEEICSLLVTQITEEKGQTSESLEERTKHLQDKSHASRDESVKECC